VPFSSNAGGSIDAETCQAHHHIEIADEPLTGVYKEVRRERPEEPKLTRGQRSTCRSATAAGHWQGSATHRARNKQVHMPLACRSDTPPPDPEYM